jgi:tetratricopeptide (TPR) repeat protein
VLLHAAVGAALFGFVARLAGALLPDTRETQARWLALGGALLFVLHPAAVYGVAYLMQRSIILATLFSTLALWGVLEALLRGRRAWYAAAAIAYLLAVFSKEHAVMVPAVAVALAVLVRGASWQLARTLALALLPLAAVGAYVVLRSRGLLGSPYEPFAADAFGSLSRRGAFDAALSYPLSVLNQATLFFRYLATWLLPWPGWMSIDVRTPFPARLLDWPFLLGFAAWLAWGAGGAWLILQRGRRGLLGLALLFPWLMAFTEFSAVRIQEVFVLYRSYLWMSLPLALLPALLWRLAPRAPLALVVIACIAFVPLARERLETFSSALKAWDDAVGKNTDLTAPNVERALVARGIVHLEQGRLDAASSDFEQALRINPLSPDAYLGRATLRLRTGRLQEAQSDLDVALAHDPRYGEAFHKRCIVKVSLRRAAEAIHDCEAAQQLVPANHEVWINSGVVYRALGRREDAEKSYQRAFQLAPDDASAHYNYGVLLLDSGRRDETVLRHITLGCKGGIPAACSLLPRR